MIREIPLLKHKKQSNLLQEYSFAVYCTEDADGEALQRLLQRMQGEAGEPRLVCAVDYDGKTADLRLDDIEIAGLEDEDRAFLYEVEGRIAFGRVETLQLPREDAHYPRALRKPSDPAPLYLIVTIYYFHSVLSEARQREIIESELSLQERAVEKTDKRAFRQRDTRFIVVLNVILVCVCFALAVYCYIHKLNTYGIFMLFFAFFFAAWGRKFARVKRK